MPTVSILSEIKSVEACEYSKKPSKLGCDEDSSIDVVAAAYGVLLQTNSCGFKGNCPPSNTSLQVSTASNCNIQSHMPIY